jgi:hypothetical protein
MTLVGDVVRTQARIKSAYRSRGVLVTGIDVYSSRRRSKASGYSSFSHPDICSGDHSRCNFFTTIL